MTRSATGGGSRWAAPTLALLMGALLVAVGGGVGLPHLAKVGLAPTTALGLVALLAGVVLAALPGSRDPFRWRILAAAPRVWP